MLSDITDNIAHTIGVPYEILAVANGEGKQGICKIYNQCAKKAAFDILCFMHEDIAIETMDWGKKLLDTMERNPQLGLLGVAGSTYRSSVPSGWFPPYPFGQESWRINIKQQYKFAEQEGKHDYHNPLHESLSRVVCVDGVWFATRKHVTQTCSFDERLLKGFHGYDIDFSLSVGQHYTVGVMYDILITHFSEGNFGEDWLKEMLKVHVKWANRLPINYENRIEAAEVIEKDARKKFLSTLTITKSAIPFHLKLHYLRALFTNRQITSVMFGKYLWRMIKSTFHRRNS